MIMSYITTHYVTAALSVGLLRPGWPRQMSASCRCVRRGVFRSRYRHQAVLTRIPSPVQVSCGQRLAPVFQNICRGLDDARELSIALGSVSGLTCRPRRSDEELRAVPTTLGSLRGQACQKPGLHFNENSSAMIRLKQSTTASERVAPSLGKPDRYGSPTTALR